MKQVPSNTKSYDKDSGRTKQKRKKKKKKDQEPKKTQKKTFNMKAAMGEGHLQGRQQQGWNTPVQWFLSLGREVPSHLLPAAELSS